jgi:hypothetical protein
LSSASVCIEASMLFSTMPMLAVSCSRKVRCGAAKSFSDASASTALISLSNITGNTTTLRGSTSSSPDPTGTASCGTSVTRIAASRPRTGR